MKDRIERVCEHLVLANRYVEVFNDEVTLRNGDPAEHVRIDNAVRGPGVAMGCFCGESVALVRVFRYPIGRPEWGIPRGFADTSDVQREAAREMGEEIGLYDLPLRLASFVTADSGVLSSESAIFLTELGERVPLSWKDDGEIMDARWFDLDELMHRIGDSNDSEFLTFDAFTLCAIALRSFSSKEDV